MSPFYRAIDLPTPRLSSTQAPAPAKQTVSGGGSYPYLEGIGPSRDPVLWAAGGQRAGFTGKIVKNSCESTWAGVECPARMTGWTLTCSSPEVAKVPVVLQCRPPRRRSQAIYTAAI